MVFNALFCNDIINVYDDLLKDLYGNNEIVIKMMVYNSELNQKNEIRKWVNYKQ